MILVPNQVVSPVLLMASPTINKPAIKMILGLLNPEKVSVVVNTPDKLRAIILEIATTSGRSFPEIKRMMVMVKMIKVVVNLNEKIK